MSHYYFTDPLSAALFECFVTPIIHGYKNGKEPIKVKKAKEFKSTVLVEDSDYLKTLPL
jgi:hypothetical protein